MRSIVINREFGSGGREIGKRLSRELNMPFYDSNILLHAAERYGINPDVIKDCDEKLIVGMRYNFAAFVTQNGEAMKLPYKMYEAIADIIRIEAMKEPSIFIGRCADKILSDRKIPFLSVYVYASNMEDRRKRVAETEDIDFEEIDEYINKKDKARKAYQKYFAGTILGENNQYDICLNSSKLGYENCVKVIKNLL